jgi:replication factor A1
MSTDGSPPVNTETRLRDLRVSEPTVAIIARIVTLQRREVTRRSDGGRRPVLSGLLSDGTATVPFTWWDPPTGGIDRGTVIRAANVQVREFRGRPELSFGWRTRVAPASELELPEVRAEDLPVRSVRQIAPGDEGFRLDARVVRVRPKTVSVGEERRLIHEGTLADGTGTVAFTAWTDLRLKEGEAVRFSGLYARGFRGRPQLVLDERTRAERIGGEGLPDVREAQAPAPSRVADLEAAHGGEWVAVEGIAVGLSPPSGVVYRCPTCQRTVTKGLCRLHGAVAAVPDLRARVVLDDGTGALTLHLGRALTERLWGRTLESALDSLRELPDPERLGEELFVSLFGRRLMATGRASSDDFGVTLEAEAVEEVRFDPGARAAELEGASGGGR